MGNPVGVQFARFVGMPGSARSVRTWAVISHPCGVAAEYRPNETPFSRDVPRIPMLHTQSHAIFHRAQQLMPGGVNSPARAFGGVGGEPVVFERAAGAYLYDVDGNHYIDYVGAWGP